MSDTFGDWDSFDRMLDADRFAKLMKAELKAAYRRLGIYARALIRRRITAAQRYKENSLVTELLKGGTTPVLAKRKLYESIEFEVRDTAEGAVELVVYVKGSPKTSSGRTIAEIVHDGAVIRVTPAMRAALFARLARKGVLGQLPPTGPAKEYWVIPPRPFIRDPMSSPVYRKRVESEIKAATERVFATLSGTSPPTQKNAEAD